jgi:hypothetical protein|tara:strand:+ start:102 stop:443 length:342 start_codon:yes stop_codon:yes gene_type:complete
MGKSKGKMKKMSRQQQKAVGASMAESGINMNAQQMVAQPAQQMTNIPPAPANTLGQAQPVFNQQAQQNAQGIFGTQQTMQNSVGAPLMFEDQTGDGKITQADVIKARTEGYKK